MYAGGDAEGQQPHVVVLTRAEEFHLVGRACVGVRRRRTGEWLRDHEACCMRLRGSRPLDAETLWPGALRAGTALVLEGDGAQSFVSDEVLSIEHPRAHESERVLAEAWSALTRPRDAKGTRWLALATVAGLLPWLSARS